MITDQSMFLALVQQHRAAYLHTLPTRLAQLDVLSGQVMDAAQRAVALPALERCAHSLAGSAGTFGFTAVGETARRLELVVEEALDGAERGAQLLAALSTLRRQLHGVLAGAGIPEEVQ
jgi:HPt (histidine-containing phosphotransfer) domain-containing protein